MAIDRLHERIRCARHQAGLSQAAVAHRIGVGRSAVSQWEQADGTCPSIGNLAALGVLTGTSLHWLLEGRGPMHVRGLASEPGDQPPATPQELAFLSLYRGLSARRRTLAAKLLERMATLG